MKFFQRYPFITSGFILIVIIVLGFILRWGNVSPFKFYPDSYQNLLVAGNIRNYHSVVGYLGKDGMVFPPFFLWSRPVFPLLINFFTFFLHDITNAAYVVSFCFGLLAVPLVFFLLKKVFLSNRIALFGALLMAISFQHIVWSGFIMTETTGVFFMLLFLSNLFVSLEKKTKLANKNDLLTGVFFTCAVFTRYEYAIVVIPVVFLIFTTSPTRYTRLTNIAVGAFCTALLIFSLLYPIWDTIAIVLSQQQYLLFFFAGICFLFTCFILFINHKYILFLKKYLPKVLLILVWIIAMFILFQMLFPQSISLFGEDLSSIEDFFLTDFLLGIFSLIGITMMLLDKKKQNLAFFILVSLGLLWGIYHKINPGMDRYMTHLIPFLIIPASYGLLKIVSWRNRIGFFLSVVIVLLFCLQIYVSFSGLKKWDHGEWFQSSYDESSARMTAEYIKDKNIVSPIQIVSLPEPYYYFSHISTTSVADSYPYVFMDESLKHRPLFIIVDMGMREVFPNFTKVVTEHLQKNLVKEFWVHKRFRYADYAKKETFPVMIYQTTLDHLETVIKTTKQ